MPFFVITGGPGSGKTTLLRELAKLGHQTVSESAREIIVKRRASGESPRPDAPAFALEILRRDVQKYEQQAKTQQFVFFDRAVPEALAMVRESRAMEEDKIIQLQHRFTFSQPVFVLPPWKDIYAQDAERDHSFEHASVVHERVVACYKALGYELLQVPAGAVEQRARQVLAAATSAA